MDEFDENDTTDLSTTGKRRVPWDLRLKTLKSSRASFARIVRAFALGLIDDQTFRTFVFGFQQYLGYLKTESLETMEERLQALEQKAGAK